MELSPLDLTLVTTSIANKCSWNVNYNNSLGSDHFPVTTKYNCQFINNKNQTEPKWNLKKADWKKF